MKRIDLKAKAIYLFDIFEEELRALPSLINTSKSALEALTNELSNKKIHLTLMINLLREFKY